MNVEVTPREELIILALYDKELYGLEISKAIEQASNEKLRMSVGTLYPLLHSLEDKGLIKPRWGDEGRGERKGARRCYYKLTASGVATFEAIQSFRANLVNWQPGVS
jgi:DNA-binding PadR family transcriptional regulator